MTTIDRYVAFAFLRSYVLLVALGVGLYIVSDLLVNLDEFTENRALTLAETLGAMVDYYGYNLPLFFAQLGGPALAFAAAYTVAMMLRNNEMTALVAAGMPLQRLAAPILISSVFLVALWMANREFVLPEFAHKIARDRDDVTGTSEAGIALARDQHDTLLRAARIDVAAGTLERVVIIEPRQRGGHVIQADAAIYEPRRDSWRLVTGRRIVLTRNLRGGDAGVRREPIAEYPFRLSPEELLLRQSAEWAGLLSLREMNTLLSSRNLPNLATVNMQRHIWMTQPLLQWLLLLLTVPFFLTREPTSVLASGAWALLLSGAFYAVVFYAHSTIVVQWAALVAWVPILLFSPVAVLLMANVKT